MGALPVPPLPTGTVDIAGTAVAITSLSRDAVVALANLSDDTTAAEVLMIAGGTGVTPDEAAAWRKSVDATTAAQLLEAIAVLSGIRAERKGQPKGEA